jgi:hypothetical protein
MTTKTLLAALALWAAAGTASAQGVRQPVWAGAFYEADPARLSAEIESALAAAAPAAVAGEIRALIVPHAGYVYSGRTAAFGYKLARGGDFETVVILGPSHRVAFEGASIWPDGGFATPLGLAEVDEAAARALTKSTGFRFVAQAHAGEHSVEVQIPFLQKSLPRAKIVPVVLGFLDEAGLRRLGAALADLAKAKKILIVASTDMSHFLDRKAAQARDAGTIALIRGLKTAALCRGLGRPDDNRMCGGGAVLAALFSAQKMGRPRVEILKVSDSAEAGGPDDRVVGYLAAAITTPAPAPAPDFSLDAGEKKALLGLARRAVETYVRDKRVIEPEASTPKLLEPRAVFVTLTEGGELRGCIGFTEALMPLAQAVVQGAVYAACRDPRFSPVAVSELGRLNYEVSVLTPLRRIDDPRVVQVGRHGLVVSRGEFRGLLLPQVATENGWDREEFLAQTCLKAGLPRDAWKRGVEIFVFEAIVFH